MSLGNNKIQDIEQKALDVLIDVYGSVEKIQVPVDLNTIMDKYELKLKSGSFQKPSIAGAYDKESKTIYVSESDQVDRQKFTIGHELGHYFLHEHIPHEVFYRDQLINLDNTSKTYEQEANWFAASLLMPEPLIKALWAVSKDINQIAESFKVSFSAAKWRLKNLNLIE